MNVEKDKVVTIEYTLKDEDCTVLETTKGEGPYPFLFGHSALLPVLEKELEGKSKGFEINRSFPPEETFGVYSDDMIFEVTKDDFEEDDIEVGVEFYGEHKGEMRIMTIRNIEGEVVKVDANHPYADKKLSFEIVVMNVRDSTDEEKQHGHVHIHGESCDH